MDKLYFKKNTLIRTEHFGMLILTLDGIRFSVPSRFEPLLAAIG